MTEWEKTTLGKICEDSGGNIQTGPFGSQLHASDYVPVGIPSIMPQNIGDNRVMINGIARITDADAKRLSRYLVKSGDIVYSRRGDVERRALIRETEEGWLCGTGCLRVRFGDKKPISSTFISYYLDAPNIRTWIVQHAVGATMPNLNTAILFDVPVLLPPYHEQKAIADVLSALDDRIELNRHMNQTLEATAQALFKSWFVGFDPVKAKAEGRKPEGMDDTVAALFPSNFSASSLGLIPEGWDMAEMGEVADVIDCLHSKKPERTNEGKPFLQLNNIRDDGLMDMTDMYLISDEDYKKWVSRIEAQEGDCVITNVGRVGAVAQIPKGLKAALGRNMTAIRTKSSFKNPTFLICYLCSDFAKNEIRLKEDTGTILNALNVRNIPKLRFFKANKAVHDEFEKLVRPIRSRMEQNLAEITTLANIRDLLLPRLISGKLRVGEISDIVEALAL